MPNMYNWPLRKSFNQLCFKENVMMNRYEKWEHDRNMDEIVDRLSELLVNIMLMSVRQTNDRFLILNKRWEQNQSDDIPF
jgi:hypothetical protein